MILQILIVSLWLLCGFLINAQLIDEQSYTCTATTRNTNPLCIRDYAKNLTNNLQRNFSLRATVRSINNVMEGPKSTFRTAQISYNSTDEILDKFDFLSIKDSFYKSFELLDETNLIVQTFNVKTTEIAGIAIYRNNNSRSSKIYRNSSLSDVVYGGNFLAAAYLPVTLLDQIAKSVATPIVIITVFLKDSLFIEMNAQHVTAEINFGILIPGFKEEFEEPLKLAYARNEGDDKSRECAHWLYGPNTKGKWNTDQASSVCGVIDICEYNHVTHFAMLILDSTDDTKTHKSALDTITFVGSLLSIAGFSVIYLTGCLFKKWRENKGNVILVNYAVASEIMIILLYASGHIKENTVCDNTWCFWIGILLHYSVLAQFFWILVISYLQYKRYVQVLGAPPTRLLLKASLIGWLSPLPIVIIVGLVAGETYIASDSNVCYPSGLPLYLGVLLPILLIVIINIVVFILIARAISHTSQHVPRLADNIFILRTRLIVFLFFQLGLSWIFGFLSNVSIAFVYLFCITGSLQGFIVFLIFIVFNDNTKQYYKKLFGCKKKEQESSKESGTTRSTSFVQQSMSS